MTNRIFKNSLNYFYQKKFFGLVIGGFIATAIFSWIYLTTAIKKNIEYRLQTEMNTLLAGINSNVFNHANTLGYIQAYFKTEGLPDRKTFRRLAESIEIQQTNHGIQGLGYISIVKKNDLQNYISTHKNIPFFNVAMLTKGRPLYAPITMVEPLNKVRCRRLGADLLLEETRKDAVERAIESTGLTMSRPLSNVVFEDPDANQPTMILLAPFYKTLATPATAPERLENIRGLIYIPMRMRNFFEATFEKPHLQDERINFEVAFIDEKLRRDVLLYKRFDLAPEKDALTKTSTLDIYGHKWRVTVTTFPSFFYFGDRYLANAVAIGFTVFILLMIILFRQTQNLLLHETNAKNLMKDAVLQSRDQAIKLKHLNDMNSSTDLEMDLKQLIEDFFKGSSIVSQSSHAFLFCSQSVELPERITFYKSQGFGPQQLKNEELSLFDLNQLADKSLIRKNDSDCDSLFTKFILGSQPFIDWIAIFLPSREFRRFGLLFLGRTAGNVYSDIDIEIIENMVSQFGIRTDNSRLFKKVEDANKVKTAFLSNMSHEIRTPLNAITGFSEMLEQTASPSEKRGLIEGIKKNTNQLTGIIENILDISKIEFGRLLIYKKKFSLAVLIDEVEKDLQERTRAKGLGFELKMIGALPVTVESDESRIRQILLNLLGNAVKFTEKGFIQLQIQSQIHVSGHRLVWTITDTGIGIAEMSKADLFKSFSQIETSNTRRFGGIGLGLALSRRLAQQFGATVSLVKSQLHQGSVFQLTTPCTVSETTDWFTERPDACHLKMRSSLETNPGTRPELTGKNILIVEDSLDNQEIFRFFLKAAGARTSVVENGEDAVTEVSRQVYDVVLMDIQLPKMDGLEATRRIRSLGFLNPIIALTAHASAEEKMNCLTAGCVDLITKPVTQTTLIKRIKMIMEETPNVIC